MGTQCVLNVVFFFTQNILASFKDRVTANQDQREDFIFQLPIFEYRFGSH